MLLNCDTLSPTGELGINKHHRSNDAPVTGTVAFSTVKVHPPPPPKKKQQSNFLSLHRPLDLLLSVSQAMQSSVNGEPMWKAHCRSLVWVSVLIVPPMVPSYIYRLLTTATDNLRSIRSTTAIAISLILHRIPQKVTEMESEATGKAEAHRQFQWAGREGLLWEVGAVCYLSHFSKRLLWREIKQSRHRSALYKASVLRRRSSLV